MSEMYNCISIFMYKMLQYILQGYNNTIQNTTILTIITQVSPCSFSTCHLLLRWLTAEYMHLYLDKMIY